MKEDSKEIHGPYVVELLSVLSVRNINFNPHTQGAQQHDEIGNHKVILLDSTKLL